MFVLQLNDMRASNVENLRAVARAETKEELEDFMEKEKVESYTDGRYTKNFRQNSLLEWFNPPWSLRSAIVDARTAEQWASDAIERFNEQVMVLPSING